MRSIWLLIVPVVLLGAVGVWWYFTAFPVQNETVFCPADAMQCADGTWVGRTGPNCEFVCPGEGSVKAVQLFYYNPALDQGPGGAQCSAAGLVAVDRSLPLAASVEDGITLLFKGELTAQERTQGLTTEFPLEGVELLRVEQEADTLTLVFADPLSKTSGGACRAQVLWLQIEATAKAITGAGEVRFLPEELFQP